MNRYRNFFVLLIVLGIGLSTAVIIPNIGKSRDVNSSAHEEIIPTIPRGITLAPTKIKNEKTFMKLNPFGIMLGNSVSGSVTEIDVAKTLGAKYMRSGVTLTQISDPKYKNIDNITKIVNSGLGSILTISYDGGKVGGEANKSGAADIELLKSNLAIVIDKIHPIVVVYENEEDSPNKNFFNGTAEQYIDGLKAVCEVAHQKGTRCTNGGITSGTSILMTGYYYEKESPDINKFNIVTDNTLGKGINQMFENAGKKTDTAFFRKRMQKARDLITKYKSSGADYVNFHYYGNSAAAFKLVASYLSQLSGLPAMTNETGLSTDSPPDVLAQLMKVAIDVRMPYMVVFSFDNTDYGIKSLVNSDGSLRPEGFTYQQFIKSESL